MRRILPILIISLLVAAPLAGAEKKLIPPDKFKVMLYGKSKVEVKELLGPPNYVEQYKGDDTGRWMYGTMVASYGKAITKSIIVYDDISEKAAYCILIYFDKGKVEVVRTSFSN